MLTLAKFLFLTVIVAHWMACAWHMVKIVEVSPSIAFSRLLCVAD